MAAGGCSSADQRQFVVIFVVTKREQLPSQSGRKWQLADFGRNVYFIPRLWPRHRSASWWTMGFAEEVL